MSTSSSDAEDAPTPAAPDEPQGVNPWIVRFFLILAFGLAFGIEGMTLVRSYLLNGNEEAEEQVTSNGGDGGATEAVGIGDDLLPTTTVSERVAQMRIQARSDGPWAFRLVVTVVNKGERDYRLSFRTLEADDGTVYDDVQSATCPPGDSTRLAATWPIGANARPEALTVEAELKSPDSTRTVRRRVSFGHVPVRMER